MSTDVRAAVRSSWIVRAVREAIVRHRAQMDRIPVERFSVRVARTGKEYEEAFRLLYAAYVFEGIQPLKRVDMRMNEQHVLPEATVLVAYEGEQLVGTATLTLDSPAGLPLDREYPVALDRLRRQGARVGEIGSLAVVRRCQKSGLLLQLGNAVARLGFRVLGTTHQVMGVHPRAEDVYRALWGFEALGEPCTHAELDAPVLGMVQERERGRAHMRKHYCKSMPQDYPIGEPPLVGLDIPEGISRDDWSRWKMPREVFQRLFVERSDRLSTLSPRTERYLRQQRSDETLNYRAQAVEG